MAEIININKNLIPYSFEIILGGITHKLSIDYNNGGDFFAIDLSNQFGNLVHGEKILLNQVIFQAQYEDENLNLDPRFPRELLIALANNSSVDKASWDHLGSDVFIYVVKRSEVFTGE